MNCADFIREVEEAGGHIRLVGLEVKLGFPTGRRDLLERGRAIKEELQSHLLMLEAKRYFDAPRFWILPEDYYLSRNPEPVNRINPQPTTKPGGTEEDWREVAGRVITGSYDEESRSYLESIQMGLSSFKGPLMEEARNRINRLIKQSAKKSTTRKRRS